MSGIEAAGVILAVIPLMISGMEHYEDTKKTAWNWWRIKRAHRRDCGRLEDIQIEYNNVIRELLDPLVSDGTVSQAQYKQLLEEPLGKAWHDSDIVLALEGRLQSMKSRFLDIIKELNRLVVELAAATKVNDPHFQTVLQQQAKRTGDPALRAKITVSERLIFEIKRAKYSVSDTKRNGLIDEVDYYIGKLRSFLQSCDKVPALSSAVGQQPANKIRRLYRTQLAYWRQAERAHILLKQAWQCDCISWHRAFVWLRGLASKPTFALDLILRCHQVADPQQKPWDEQTLQIVSVDQLDSTKSCVQSKTNKSAVKFALNVADSSGLQDFTTITSPTATNKMHGNITTEHLSPSAASQKKPKSAAQSLLDTMGLCKSLSFCHQLAAGDVIGTLRDTSDPSDEVHLAVKTVQYSLDSQPSRALSTRIAQRSSRPLLRVQGVSLAYAISNAFLQLYDTPWWPHFAGAGGIHLSDNTTGNLPQDRAFIDASFNSPSVHSALSDPFLPLAIVLLELCFGQTIEEHPMWHKDAQMFSALPPAIARRIVASEWLKDVQWHFGLDYAQAANWCLCFGSLQNPEWRVDFARSVLEPLQRCYDECMKATQPKD